MHCTKRRRTHTRATKLAYSGACVALFSSGAGSMMLLVAGILDVVFAGFFAYALYASRTRQPAVG